MRLLHWLTPSHLGEVCLQMEKPMVQEVYTRAQQGTHSKHFAVFMITIILRIVEP